VFVHSIEVRNEALRLLDRGLNDCEVARRTGISRTTIRDWRRPTYVPRRSAWPCLRCWQPARPIDFTDWDYAELLGLYLGDGHITREPRTQRLRLFLDSRYPVMLDETVALLQRSFPQNRVGRHLQDDGGSTVIQLYSSHLECLFPQHGPGRKHERRIELEDWQQDIVDAEPWAFLRGCIRSDGCVFINRTGRYRYLTYDFCNSSADIRHLFERACESVGLDCRPAGLRVRVNKRASVELLAANVGVKR
jgi:hypothetical protein